MKSLKSDIADMLRVVHPEWRDKGAIERFAQIKGYNAENGVRRARELAEGEKPLLIRDPDSKYTRYQYNAEDFPLNLGTYKLRRQRPKYKQARLY